MEKEFAGQSEWGEDADVPDKIKTKGFYLGFCWDAGFFHALPSWAVTHSNCCDRRWVPLLEPVMWCRWHLLPSQFVFHPDQLQSNLQARSSPLADFGWRSVHIFLANFFQNSPWFAFCSGPTSGIIWNSCISVITWCVGEVFLPKSLIEQEIIYIISGRDHKMI